VHGTNELIDRIRELETELSNKPSVITGEDTADYGQLDTIGICAERRRGGVGVYLSVRQNGAAIRGGMSRSAAQMLVDQLIYAISATREGE